MQDILFYDGRCSLCAHEIALLKRWKRASLVLIDIHSDAAPQLADGVSSNDLLRILHLKTSDNTWQRGLGATVRAWQHTPFGYLLIPLRWPLLKQMSDWAYLRWAAKRACNLGYSDAGQPPSSLAANAASDK